MTTHDYLSQLSGIEERILRKYEDAEVCRCRAMKMRSMRIRGDKIDSSPNPHETEDAIIQALEDEKECRRLTVQMEKKKKYLLDQLDGLQNQLHITILRGYYVDDKTFNEIGIELKRSGKSVRSNYKKALNEFEKKYGKEYLKSTTTHL